MVNNIKISETSYRGSTEYVVSWIELGQKSQDSFDSKEDAAQQVRALERKNKEVYTPRAWAPATEALLNQLQATPEELNDFLTNLTRRSTNNFKQWRDYIAHTIDMRQKLSKIASAQSMEISQLMEALSFFQDHSISEVLKTFEHTVQEQKLVQDTFGAFVAKMRDSEEDEDEISYVERKLGRFFEVFGGSALTVEADEITAFIAGEPGSENAKTRFLDLIAEVKQFADSRSGSTNA